MKKIIAILLLVLYTSTAFGVAVNYHYCKGHLAEVSLLNFGGHGGCGCDTRDMPKDCCKDNLIYQKADNHKVQFAFIAEFLSFAIEPPPSNNFSAPLPDDHSSDINTNFDRSCPQPIFLLNRVFRI